jgi:DNA-binding beta-propeller fold protein YncE
MKSSSLLLVLPFLFACGGNNGDAEVCNDNVDNDADGNIDCADDECAADPICQNPPDVVDGFDSPESVFFDAATDSWYVTNQAGNVAGDGFVSKLDAVGNIVDIDFAVGLDNPRGVRGDGGSLFVADDDGVFEIDITNGQIIDTVAVPGSNFLNDVAIDPANGTVFVSSSGTDQVFSISNGVPTVLVDENALNFPNGLLFEDGTLFIANFNGNGELFTFNPAADPAFSVFSDVGLGNVDGIERDGTDLLVTDFNGRLIAVNENGNGTLLRDVSNDVGAAADLGFDPVRRIAAIPDLAGTTVIFIDLDEL